MNIFRHLLLALPPLALLGACATPAPPMNGYEQGQQHAFNRDRDACRDVAEHSIAYVDPRDGARVSERSMRVEADIQRCMLSRGWNDPRFDGWRGGRSR